MTPRRPPPLWRTALWALVLAAAVALGLQAPTALLWVLAYCGLLPW